MAQILKINHQEGFSWFPRWFFSLIPVFRYYVNRDTLFCYHRASEVFLQRLMALYVASHYKVGLGLPPSHFIPSFSAGFFGDSSACYYSLIEISQQLLLLLVVYRAVFSFP